MSGSNSSNDARWSLMYWGGAAVGTFIFALWCVYDGWFNADGSVALNRIAAPIAFIASIWLAWQGVVESRQIRKEAEQGEAAAQTRDEADETITSGDAAQADDDSKRQGD